MSSALIGERPTPTVDTHSLRILVGDDQSDVLEALRLLLKGDGHKAVTVDSPAALLRASLSQPFDLILMDLNYARDTTSGQEGLDLITRLGAQNNTAPIVVMTAWGNVELAVEAMRRGASDFVQKPWDNARLLETIRKQSKRHEHSELELARHVQQKLFPQKTVAMTTIDYAGHCVPARVVSGDYYDFLDAGDGVLAFVLADVSGKGMAAALLMANLQASFRSQSNLALSDSGALLSSVNKLFYDSTPSEHYATLFFAQYDDRTRQLRYVNCGHVPPIVLRSNGAVERLGASATVLGLFESWNCDQQATKLNPGDSLILFSDGVTDAGIETEREFGEDRLIALLQASRKDTVDRCVHRVIEAVHNYSPENQSDDITVIAIRGQ
ncbi:MAG: PP2C family protein-serine/threonine phosphatase [Bryobacteraceae bacterium]